MEIPLQMFLWYWHCPHVRVSRVMKMISADVSAGEVVWVKMKALVFALVDQLLDEADYSASIDTFELLHVDSWVNPISRSLLPSRLKSWKLQVKSSHEVLCKSTSKSFYCQVKSQTQTQVTLGSSSTPIVPLSYEWLWTNSSIAWY